MYDTDLSIKELITKLVARVLPRATIVLRDNSG